MPIIRKIWTSKITGDTETYVGRYGEIWYANDSNDLRYSDGSTPGGIPITAGQGSGHSNMSGYSGKSGHSGLSGFSGHTGVSGFSGESGFSGDQGSSGISGYSGVSGESGTSGFTGYSGVSGISGYSGASGDIGASGHSGASGFSGTSGSSGLSGESGTDGLSGISGFSGISGTPGVSGPSGFSGTSGFSGLSGQNGLDGASGFSGSSGESGASGVSGATGLDGASGTSGVSGATGLDGASGTSGTSGASGTSGVSGYSGTSGASGTSGTSGTSGVSGATGLDGASGTSGVSGISGGTGASGFSGFSGLVGPTGATGPGSGSSNWQLITSNYVAVDGDRLIVNTSLTTFSITLPATPSVGTYVIITDGHDWSVNNLTILTGTNTIEGVADDLLITIGNVTIEFIYSGTTWQFTITTGAQGPIGLPGATGASGVSGLSGVSGFSGAQGVSGFSGLNGTGGDLLTVTDTTTNSVFYPVFVASAGANQTARIRSTTTAFSFNPGTGEVSAVDFNSMSDLQLKTNVENIQNSWQLLSQLRPVQFDWKHMDKKHFGLIAQEVEAVAPHLVSTNMSGKTVSYLQLIPLLIHTIQELDHKVNLLEDKLSR